VRGSHKGVSTTPAFSSLAPALSRPNPSHRPHKQPLKTAHLELVTASQPSGSVAVADMPLIVAQAKRRRAGPPPPRDDPPTPQRSLYRCFGPSGTCYLGVHELLRMSKCVL
jgi:hypothetical protein